MVGFLKILLIEIKYLILIQDSQRNPQTDFNLNALSGKMINETTVNVNNNGKPVSV